VLLEDELPQLAAEFQEAELHLRAVHRKAFTAALAADKVSMAHRFGNFVGSALYHDLNITRPAHPAYDPLVALNGDAFAHGRALAARNDASVQDAKQLDADADQLIHKLLNSEAE